MYAVEREYIESLIAQVSNKRAKILIQREIRNHIEDQADAYVEEGMNREEAVREAVRQMGSPDQTGRELNKIHQPQVPWIMIGLGILLTVMGLVMQIIIQNNTGYSVNEMSESIKMIAYNLLGFVIIMGILYSDYTFVARYSVWIYFTYLFMVLVISGFQYNYVTRGETGYYIAALYPIILAGLIYKLKELKTTGLLLCMASMFTIFFTITKAYGIFGGAAESLCVGVLLLTLSVFKGMFGDRKKLHLFIIWAPLIFISFVLIFCMYAKDFNIIPVSGYHAQKLNAILSPESDTSGFNYLKFRIRNESMNYRMFGEKVIPEYSSEALCSVYLLISVFSYFGITVGTLFIFLVVFLGIKMLRISCVQSNRLGFLIGMAVWAEITVKIVSYVMNNLGFGLWETRSIPFINHGLFGTVINSILVGFIFSVSYNTRILAERNSKVE